MRVTKRTNIAMRVLMFCAANTHRLVTKSEIAHTCNASENHLAQIINQLAQMGFLRTHRGRNGGLELARDAADISVGSLFRLLEAPVPLAECFADVDNTCPLVASCRLRGILSEAADAFYQRLDPVTLDFLLCENEPLLAILESPVRCTTRQAAPEHA
ncbi:MAG: RrF2 family transcriptional regulator [Paracoccaceae bacterium]